MNPPVRVLYVDDNPLDRELVRDALEKEHGGFELVEAASRADFETTLAQGGFDLVLSDFNILGFEGLQVLEAVRTTDSHLPVIIVTGTGSEEVAAEAIKRGAADYVIKTPKHIQRLPYIIHAVLEKKRLEDQRQQAEEALRASEARYRMLAENMSDTIWLMDMNLKTTYVSPSVTRLRGYALEELNTIPLDQQMPPDSLQRAMQLFSEVLSPENLTRRDVPITRIIELEFYKKDGSMFWSENNFTLIRDQGGAPIAILGAGRDTTERKRAEEEIRKLNAELEGRVEERTRELREAQEKLVHQERLAVLGQLAGGVGHELRNPLGVIGNAIYFLKLIQPNADDKTKEYFGIIENEIRTAENIITDLLDYSRIKSVDSEPVEVTELIRRVLERYPAPPAVTVSLKTAARLPPVYADSRQMLQVLGNLVVNAYQAMPEGGKLALSAKKKGDQAVISVQDTGVGIPPENMAKLFEPLFTTKMHGIGLGLAVCKKLVEANNGRIEVNSAPGKGATFSIYLPVYKEES